MIKLQKDDTYQRGENTIVATYSNADQAVKAILEKL